MFWIDGWWRPTWAEAKAKAELIGVTRISKTYGHPARGEDPTKGLTLYAVKAGEAWARA